MSRSVNIPLSLALLAFLCLQAQAFSLFEARFMRNTIMNAHASSTGIIELKKDSHSFYVEADLNTFPFNSGNSSNLTNTTVSSKNGLDRSDSVRFMISIPNDDSMAATNCLSFDYYECSKYRCYEYSWAKTIDFPGFTATTKAVGAYIYLDYFYWGLTTSDLYLAQSCYTGDSSSRVGYNRYGVLGLGTGNKDNFISSIIFSIYIEPHLQKGKLLFMKDESYAQTNGPLYTLNTNSTWQLSFSSGYIELPSYAVGISYGNLMFDINSDAIGLPFDVYSLFINYFTYTQGVLRCNAGKYKPTCYSSIKVEDLPEVTLSFNSYKISIPPKIYATPIEYKNGEYSFSFNFKGTDQSFSGKSYVTPAFQRSVILDANFMSYYYAVFDATSGSNVIYIYPSINVGPKSNNALWIAAGAAGAIFVIAGLLYCCCAKKKRKIPDTNSTTAAPLNVTNDAFNTIQAPLIYNQQGVNDSAPSYSYDTNLYNYQGYTQAQGMYGGVSQQPQGIVYTPGYGAAPGVYPQTQERIKQ